MDAEAADQVSQHRRRHELAADDGASGDRCFGDGEGVVASAAAGVDTPLHASDMAECGSTPSTSERGVHSRTTKSSSTGRSSR